MIEEFSTIDEIALKCVTLSGINEENLLASYERRCLRLKILALWGQLQAALKRLHKAGKVKLVKIDGHRLLKKVS